MMDITALAAEFPRNAVHWRVQGQPYERNGKFSAMALAYIDARDVMDRLDEICGPENWQDEYVETVKGRIICRIGIFVNDRWVWKSDGAGETAVEGDKGGISDALKRAAVHWGIGRYLYRLDSPWVQCEVSQKNGKTYWKKWAEDPWAKVKQVGYTPPAPPPAKEEKPVERNPRKIADGLIGLFDAAKAYDKVQAIRGKNSAALDWLAETDPPKFNEVKAAENRALQRVDPAAQGPDNRGVAA